MMYDSYGALGCEHITLFSETMMAIQLVCLFSKMISPS